MNHTQHPLNVYNIHEKNCLRHTIIEQTKSYMLYPTYLHCSSQLIRIESLFTPTQSNQKTYLRLYTCICSNHIYYCKENSEKLKTKWKKKKIERKTPSHYETYSVWITDCLSITHILSHKFDIKYRLYDVYVLASQTGVNCRRLNNNMKAEFFFDIFVWIIIHYVIHIVQMRYLRRIGWSTLNEVW